MVAFSKHLKQVSLVMSCLIKSWNHLKIWFYFLDVWMPFFLFSLVRPIRLVSFKHEIKLRNNLQKSMNFLHNLAELYSINVHVFLGVSMLIKVTPSIILASSFSGSKVKCPISLDTSVNLTFLCTFPVCHIQIMKLDNGNFHEWRNSPNLIL